MNKKLTPLEWIVSSLFIVILFVVVYGVFKRYVLNDALRWGEEFTQYAFAWLVMLGAVLAFERGEHVRVDFFIERMPEKFRVFFNHFNDVMTFLIFLFTLVFGINLVIKLNGQISAALMVPTNYFLHMSLPVASALILFVLIKTRIAEFCARRKGDSDK